MQQRQPVAQLSNSFDNCRRSNQSDGTFYLHVFAINAVDAVREIPLGEKVIPILENVSFVGNCMCCNCKISHIALYVSSILN